MSLPLPRPLSHSSISMYQECPQKYKFKYIDKIPEKPKHFFSFGSSVHEALEYFYGVTALPAPTLEQVLQYLKDHWKSEGYKDETQEAQYFDDGKVILTAFYKKHIESYHIPFFVEYNFNLEVDGVPVTGKVDRIDKLEDGRIAILDYKTGKAIPADRVAGDSQLTMYQMACEELLGAKVARLTFYHLPSLKELTIERHSQDQVDVLRRRVVTTAEGIMQEAFAPKPDEKKCFWCDYKPICPIFKHGYSASRAPRVEVSPNAPLPAHGAPSLAEEADAELTEMVDRYGDLHQKAQEAQEELQTLKQAILVILKKKGYMRAFGKKFELARAGEAKWEFSDKAKVLELIKKAGLYEKILAPSAPMIARLMADPTLEPGLKAKLEKLGEKIDASDLKIKPLPSKNS